LNNPPVGLVTPDTDPDLGVRQTYAYDPHLDPQLMWAGKAEHNSFNVPTVSLHVHERIDPRTIIKAVQKRPAQNEPIQLSLFQMPEENLPLREAIDFYNHSHGWCNRLVAGYSFLVMNSLLDKEGLGGKVQMVYIDPSYGIVETLWHLRVHEAYNKDFWLDLEMTGSASLDKLDKYLRAIWLECCGHLSKFTIGGWGGMDVGKARKADSTFEPGLVLRHL